ncbi:ALG6 [Fragilaria crotonensis]|nr:ALG6 [Fragilaria crotonensis]
MRFLSRGAIVWCLLPFRSVAFLSPLQPHSHLDPSLIVRNLARIDIQAASAKLQWEILEERMARPVVDLSKNREEIIENEKSALQDDTSDWDQGQRWSETSTGLLALGLSSPDELLLTCPQLYRLETSQILETSKWLIQQEGFGVTYIVQEPRVLSYKRTDVEYGLEFLKLMTMSTSLALLVPLLLSGIEGGLQERAVNEALGAAAEATYNANQRIAGDAAATLKSLKQKGPGFML